jgi:hypothetical protein
LLASITRRYPSLFKGGGSDDEGDTRRQDRAGLIWLKTVDKLARGDRAKYDYFLKMGIIEFLNSCSFEHERGRARGERLNQASSDAKRAKDINVYVVALLQELLD